MLYYYDYLYTRLLFFVFIIGIDGKIMMNSFNSIY